MKKLKKSFVIYPFIFAVLPTLYLYAYNVKEVLLSVIIWPVVIAVALTFFLMLLTWLINRNLNKNGLIIAFFIIFFISTGNLFYLKTFWGTFGEVLAWILLFLIWVLLLPFISYKILKARTDLRKVTTLFNVTAIALLLMVSFKIGVAEAQRLNNDYSNIDSAVALPLNFSEEGALPDIYYIILERYAPASTMEDIYDFDNSDFINYLNDKGFYVASEAAANYVMTCQSLASSLNMEYIDYMDEGWTDEVPLREKIEDNVIQCSLRSAGYKFINVGSWWDATRENKYADININYRASISQFSESLLCNTAPYSVLTNLGLANDYCRDQWERTLYEFEQLAEIPAMEEPTFTFAHMFITHDPYVFNQDGSYMPPEEATNRSEKDNYVNQVIVSNDMVTSLIDQLLSTSKTAPIIILQADEGPYPERYLADRYNFKWEQATDVEIRQKMRIFSAYYLPGMDDAMLYPSITPVNSFRVVFNLYFGTNLGLLPDEVYTVVDRHHPYKFLDVTDKAKYD